jgi:S-DNA-T family DNA segregation ATPase FtsK/SpoIIIE
MQKLHIFFIIFFFFLIFNGIIYIEYIIGVLVGVNMIIYILHNDRYFSFRLPRQKDGSFVLHDFDGDSFKRNLVNISAVDSKWIMKSNDKVKILFNNQYIESIELLEYSFYSLITNNNELIYLYVSPGNDQSFVAKKCISKEKIVFGSDSSCDVIFASKLISPKQFEIVKEDNMWSLKNLDSKSLLYVNERRCKEKLLNSFDYIFINGFKIIICGDVFFINNPSSVVQFSQYSFIEYKAEFEVSNNSGSLNSFSDFYEESDYFSKSPVFRKKTNHLKVIITSPDEKDKRNDSSIIMSIVPSALMSVTTLLSAYFSVKNYNSGTTDRESLITTVVMCIVMLFISIVWPFVERFAESFRAFINNINRNIKYLSYIKKKRIILEQARNEQKLALQFNNLSLEECQDVIVKKTANLFSINSEQKNFLDVKLGVGKVKMDCEFDYTKPDFIKVKDKLLNVIDKLIEDYKYIDSAPYSFSLVNNVAFIYGEKDYENYLSSLVLQLITYHDYFNLKLVVFTSEGSFLTKIRNLNHCWNNDRTMRFFATDVQDAETLSSYLVRIFNSRMSPSTENNDSSNLKVPFYLIICDDMDKYRNLTIIDKVLHQKEKNFGFSFVTFAQKITDVPDCCSYFVDFKDEISTLFQSEMDESNIMKFSPELVNSKINIQECLTIVANTPIKSNSEVAGLLPDKLSFLEMNNVGKIEQLNSIKKWKTSQIVNTLAAPIGVDINGNILSLDLHEKKHGPHGLIAGMTGSGKSEFIITYILSLSVNYSPEEVQFVLIDYKGGGLAGAFENRKTGVKLPHLVGTITNLDKSSMNRTLVSIKSELQRRQRVFNEAKELLNTGTIDIYKYQKLVRDGSLSDPMSHLFIICDEFAELKTQQPDFMDELVSAARIGRSLGIHLILATQKPSGVVDDQIWSNAKFKVCCKVQTADDSKEMIRRDDAAFIKESGRFFLQVGYDEIFVKGQSAYTGSQYKPADTVINSDVVREDVEFIDNLGNVTLSVKNEVNTVKDENDYGDELGNVLNYLVQCAKEIGFVNKQLWLDNVPEKLYLYNLYKKYPVTNKKGIICPLIGEYDDPQNQKQGPVNINITERGNLWISGIYGSGKTTLLSTIIYSSVVNYSTQELNIYIVDLLAETLKMFCNVPQVGDFVSSSEPTKLNKLFHYLTQEVQKRKRYYSNLGSTFLSETSKGNIVFPNIFVIVNGIDILAEQYDSLYNDVFMPLVRDCNRVGIYFIITSTGSINVVVENSFPQKIAMRYLDTTEYAMLYNNARGIVPNINPGRGLVELDSVYEFQTAMIFDDINFDYNLNYVINQLNRSLTKAPSIPVMPRIVTYENVKDEIVSLSSLPVGIDISSNCPLSFDFNKIINLVVYSNEKMAASFVSGFIKVLNDLDNLKIIVLDNIGVTSNVDGVQVFNSNFKKVCQALYKNINEKKSSDIDAEKIIFIVSGYSKINNHLKKLLSEEDDVKTVDDLISSSLNSENFKFIIVNDKSLSSIDDKEWSDYLDSGYGILLGTEKDDQSLIELEDSYDEVKINKDTAIVVDDFKKKYVKFIRDRS